MTEAFGARGRFKTPGGGLAFWLTLPDESDLDRIEARGPELGVRLASSRSFASREGAGRGLRIGFASLREDEARKALFTLAKAAGI